MKYFGLLLAAGCVAAAEFFSPMAWGQGALGQGAFREVTVRAQYRDGVFDVDRGLVYVAAYDRNEVLAVDIATGEVSGGVMTGKGPGSLALSVEGGVLACVNRLDETVSLIAAPEMRVLTVVACEDGAASVTALPGGGFAVTNSFADSVTLIDGRSGQVTATLRGVASVPTVIAASQNYLAVGVREPAGVLIYEGGAQRPAARLALDDAPRGLVALAGNRFGVATDGGVYVVEGGTGGILAEWAGGARALASWDDRIVGLVGESVRVFDGNLRVLETIPGPAGGYSVVSGGAMLAVMSPAERTLSLRGTAPDRGGVALLEGPAVPVAVVEPGGVVIEEAEVMEEQAPEAEGETPDGAVLVEEEEADTVVEAPLAAEEFVDEPEIVEEELVEARPVVEEAEVIPVAEPVAAEPEMTEPDEEVRAGLDRPALQPVIARAGAPAEEDETDADVVMAGPIGEAELSWGRRDRIRRLRPEERRPGRSPLGSSEPYVPALGPRTRETPTTSFRESLTRGLGLQGAPEGFQLPDVTQPLEDLQADSISYRFDDEQEIVGEGNARLRLADTQLTAERIRQNTSRGELEASGMVELRQGPSVLTADRIFYQRPPEAEAEEAREEPRFIGEGVVEEDPWSRGIVEAEGLRLREPDRSLDAEYLVYDLGESTGQLLHAHGHAGVIYFSADDLTLLGPESAVGHDVWLTTCDHPTPHYRIRLREAQIEDGRVVLGTNARLQLGRTDTPVYVPRWYGASRDRGRTFSFDFDSGRLAALGTYANVGIWTELTPNVDGAIRFMPTQKEGVGFGVNLEYDYMNTPTSPMFRSRGSLESMYTTEDRGYTHFYHRHELTPDTIVLGQYEQWYDRDFYKDFFYDDYRDRTGPRSFVNLTHRQDGYIVTGTVSGSPHDFTRETEKLPEFSFHLLEREIAPRLYFTFDTIDGYYERTRRRDQGLRAINLARLTYDWEVGPGLNLLPFLEGEASWYSETLDGGGSSARVRGRAGVTAQSRFQRSYAGRWGFSGFKHIVVPSVTYFYRPQGNLKVEDTPQFDALDSVPGRSRIEGKIDNIVLGQDAVTHETWQVARVSLYYGYDFQNETSKSDDFEVEMDIRPRPWWGFQAVAEHHGAANERDLFDLVPVLQRARDLRDRIRVRRGKDDILRLRRGDFNRILAYVYYDDSLIHGNFNARVGFAYTETGGDVFNREILYGAGYKVSEKWGVAFEHRYDLERGELARQTYEIRRRLHCWDAAFQFRDRESGFDVRFELSLAAFPGTRIKF